MRVLLVEDDAMIGDSVRQALRQEGFTVDWVRDGDAGLAAATSSQEGEACYDLVLLDLGLPRRPGLDVLRTLRTRGVPTPVLILTARDAVADRVAGLNAGADDYLVKPFDLQELAARMHALARRAAGRAEPLVTYGEIVLNPATREVTHSGEPVRLSAREFALLSALMSRPGKVWSVPQLQERLYGWDDEVGSNTVEVYIHALRKKLGAALIRNIRGVGYLVPRLDGEGEPG
ncbi:response regulator [Cupriavidus oxalaticus]|jgi:two-component system OmpR family response regulator/two-component system response regulator QseB|uniref:DNA-binding response regulator n=1 Tax=Cupriavidus oxalaticus TaxID=96344 RepID=A0A375GD27_9BURK|nr:response regulator transcription factor [Cupriavidus oxalaticus]QEZ44040.1 DNA-binding response regulator [Cupriavidus oxalaticus]QRQ84551.1 response regulator transcription factor [Cupriavidus oxalaticus]QRQ91360.1 response regulator transcription factor [Cupriavidus oxalaticus]WQD85919.1 response regulator transcription factor [Cupriavidus oxalaticus]SPC19828.1 DNA-binding response regulator in two-component regulatory system with QseC [Cupriavidus oxalaticus]